MVTWMLGWPLPQNMPPSQGQTVNAENHFWENGIFWQNSALVPPTHYVLLPHHFISPEHKTKIPRKFHTICSRPWNDHWRRRGGGNVKLPRSAVRKQHLAFPSDSQQHISVWALRRFYSSLSNHSSGLGSAGTSSSSTKVNCMQWKCSSFQTLAKFHHNLFPQEEGGGGNKTKEKSRRISLQQGATFALTPITNLHQPIQSAKTHETVHFFFSF